MKKNLKDIASLVAGELSGNAKLSVSGAAGIEDAQEGDITFAMDEKSVEKFERSGASAALVPANLKKFPGKPHIKVSNVRLSMAKVLSIFEEKKHNKPGVHKTAVVAKSATIGKNVTIMAGVFIGEDCRIGKDTVIYPNAVLYDRTIVGERCVIHAGVVLGVDGYGFVSVDGKYEKIPQIGNVVIEDDVELFANVSISRATMGSTVVKRGSKIDNLTHIAHNCKIGRDCAITGLVAIAGSTELKDHVSVGGTSGINDHITIGENTVVMGRSGVTKDIPANSVVSGFPAQDHKKELEQQAAIRRLPGLIAKVAKLEKALEPATERRGSTDQK